jgi:aquaporin Z
VVTLAFYLKKKMRAGHAAGYVASQLVGAVLGALPLLMWGHMGASVNFGATLPGKDYRVWQAVLGETVTTFALITARFFFLSHKQTQRFTPLLFRALYAVMGYIEAPVSGTSTNPARSLGPAVISWNWQGWWIYRLGPVIGMLIAIGVHRLPLLNRFEVIVGKIYHFDHDPCRIFRAAERELNEKMLEGRNPQ